MSQPVGGKSPYASPVEEALNVLPCGVWCCLKDGTLSYVNTNLCLMLGKTAEQLVGSGMFSLVHPDEREALRTFCLSAGAGANVVDVRMQSADGTWRWYRHRGGGALSVGGSNPPQTVGTVTDIHEQKSQQAELALKSDAIEHSLNAFDIIDANGRFIYVNQAYLDLWGYKDLREVLQTSPESHCADPETPRKIIAALKEHGECRIEFKARRKDGSLFDVLMWARLAHDANGNEIYPTTSFDISERKRADEALLLGKQEAERANSLKTQFLANMSHEIRTPLGVMIGLTDVLRDADLSAPERRVYVETMAKNGRQLLAMVDDILDLSKIDANRLTIEKVAVNPVRVADEIVRQLDEKVRARGLSLTYTPAHDTPTELMSDPARMRQVLLNVVTNAMKFTREGRITITSRSSPSASGEPGVEFAITDTGIGIPDAEQERIFDVFVQADGSITRRFGGTGLGLPLARKLARAMGGDVVLRQSRPGHGSTFVAKFVDGGKLKTRRGDTLTDKAWDAQRAAQASLAGVRILSVDDAPDNQTLVVYFLTRHGARVETAENGLDGYQKAIASDYDLVLMDIQMPVMDGFTATERLRQDGYEGPILALTAHASEENRTRCIAAGCSDFLSKPIQASTLVEKVRQWVSPVNDTP